MPEINSLVPLVAKQMIGGKPNGPDLPSEDQVALAFVATHPEYRHVGPWHRWLKWDGMRWRADSTGHVFDHIRNLVRASVGGNSKAERSTATAGFVAGVEKLARTDQRIVVVPEQLDADPWLLNTRSGIVDLRTGAVRPHDPAALCTRVTAAACDAAQGADLWDRFLRGITQGDRVLCEYLQRVAGYCATGVVSEDVLVYLFGIGGNGKGSFAEALVHTLGDYGKVFPAEVLMEAKGERHPTDLAQFMGVRLALTSEPGSASAWNDARVKSLTGDTVISARFMRGDFFTFPRTHKTVVIGNHLPRLAQVTHAIRRRFQMVPFNAVFQPAAGQDMRALLKAEAGGAILAWIIAGAQRWSERGTDAPRRVHELTGEYLDDQDMLGQWLDEQCERGPALSVLLNDLHRNHRVWCEGQGLHAPSNKELSRRLLSAGFHGRSTMAGKVFDGLAVRHP